MGTSTVFDLICGFAFGGGLRIFFYAVIFDSNLFHNPSASTTSPLKVTKNSRPASPEVGKVTDLQRFFLRSTGDVHGRHLGMGL